MARVRGALGVENVGFWWEKRAIRRAVAEFGRAGDGEGAGGGVPTVAKYILNH